MIDLDLSVSSLHDLSCGRFVYKILENFSKLMKKPKVYTRGILGIQEKEYVYAYVLIALNKNLYAYVLIALKMQVINHVTNQIV